jgi:hypothetical protein
VAEGLEHGDYTTISVWDANNDVMVASMRAHFPLEDLDELLYDLGEWYYWALIAVERNNQGIAVLIGLQRMRYPRMYRAASLARTRNKRSVDIGWVTSRQTKPKMITDFVAALRAQQVVMSDQDFVDEAQTFVMDGKGGYGATAGKHDDFIMGTLIGWQAVLEVGKYVLVWKDTKQRPVTFGEVFGLRDHKGPKVGRLDIPLGREPVTSGVRTGFIMSEANWKRK